MIFVPNLGRLYGMPWTKVFFTRFFPPVYLEARNNKRIGLVIYCLQVAVGKKEICSLVNAKSSVTIMTVPCLVTQISYLTNFNSGMHTYEEASPALDIL